MATQNQDFFDQTLAMMDAGHAQAALPMLAGKLYSAITMAEHWPQVRDDLHAHPLHQRLLEDPYAAHAARRPRGYPGDAALIDIIYDQTLPTETSALGRDIFSITIQFQAAEGVRLRRATAETFLTQAHERRDRICVLACGHFREADNLKGTDLSAITAVDQDPQSLSVVAANHPSVRTEEANVIRFLRRAALKGEKFDLIYTLGLTDYLDDRAMRLLHQLMKACLAPGGRIILANFVPNHLAIGWMDAIMDWQLIYRSEAELAGFAKEIGMRSRTWRDLSGSIAWCEMSPLDAVSPALSFDEA
jgi:extracellular factor (EF) 3-hydroxypalmitic acid methyl ester biosynthesis protein